MATPGGLVDKQELIDAQLDTAHLGRVVNSKDASGAPISTSTNRTGGVNKTLDALEAEYQGEIAEAVVAFDDQRDQFETTFNAQFTYKRIGNISDYAGQSLPEADKLNSYQYPDDSDAWYAPVQGQPFPITIPADPTVSGSGWVLTASPNIYRGLWPDTGGSANKGETWQTQTGGAPTGQYFTALQNTTVDPVSDDVNWREVVGVDSFSRYTDIVYKSSGGNSALDNMLAYRPIASVVGDILKTGGTTWEKVDDTGPITIENFRAFNAIFVDDFKNETDTTDDSAIDAALAVWSNSEFKGSLLFNNGSYTRTTPFRIPDAPTIFGKIQSIGMTTIDFDFSAVNHKNMVELMSVRELQIEDIWFRYLDNTGYIPECGILAARKSDGSGGDIFSGRHRFKNVRSTGYFTKAAYYNYASEEMYYENVQFRNYNYNAVTGEGIGHATVITSVNTLGASSDFDTIIDYKQSTTVFNFLNPKFDQAGFDSTTVTFLIEAATGFDISGGYMQSNGLCNIMFDASNGSVGNFNITSTQFEQSNKDTADPLYKNFDYSFVFKSNTSATPYPGSSHLGIKIKGVAEFGLKSLLIDTARTIEKCEVEVSRVVESTYSGTTDTVVKASVFNAPIGVNLTATKTLSDVTIYCDAWEDIAIPTTRGNSVKLTSLDAPYFNGDTEDTRSSVAGVLTVAYGNVKLGNPTTNLTTIELVTGAPLHGQQVTISSSNTTAFTIKHNAGNIFTSTGADVTPLWYQMVVFTYNSRASAWVASAV